MSEDFITTIANNWLKITKQNTRSLANLEQKTQQNKWLALAWRDRNNAGYQNNGMSILTVQSTLASH